jgi:hypothetical protein
VKFPLFSTLAVNSRLVNRQHGYNHEQKEGFSVEEKVKSDTRNRKWKKES